MQISAVLARAHKSLPAFALRSISQWACQCHRSQMKRKQRRSRALTVHLRGKCAGMCKRPWPSRMWSPAKLSGGGPPRLAPQRRRGPGVDKIAVAKVLAALAAAQERTKTAGLPATVPGGAFIAMRRARETSAETNLQQGQTLSQVVPRVDYTQVDDGVFLTESVEVTSQAEEAQQTDEQTHGEVVQRGCKAVIQMRRTRVRWQMPTTSDQLMRRCRGSKGYTGES